MPRPEAVLLIDDEPVEIQLVEAELAPFNVIFKGTTDPHEGIDLLHKDWFDVCFIDQFMPKVYGLELARLIMAPQMSKPPKNKRLSIYILTNYPDPPTLLEATKMNCPLIWKDKMRQMFAFLFDPKPLP